MAANPPTRATRQLNDKLLHAFAQEAARLREYAASTTTPRLRARLLEAAVEQELLAEEATRGAVRPHPRPVGNLRWLPL
jgi:hypothetical protein